jgi:hypothetical protein
VRRSLKLALAGTLFVLFFNRFLLFAQTATTTPPSSSQATTPPPAEGNVTIEELKSPNAGTRAKGHFDPDTTRIDPGVFVDPKVITTLDATLKSTRSIRASCEAAKGLGILPG